MTDTVTDQTRARRTGTSAAARQTSPRRSVNIALWTLQVLTAAMFALGGLNKLTGEAQTVAGFEKMGMGEWFRYLIGALEVAGAVAVVIPLLAGLAGLAFVGLMTGAIVTQEVVFDGEYVAVPATVLVVVAVIAWGRRHRTAQLVRLVRSVAGRR